MMRNGGRERKESGRIPVTISTLSLETSLTVCSPSEEDMLCGSDGYECVGRGGVDEAARWLEAGG